MLCKIERDPKQRNTQMTKSTGRWERMNRVQQESKIRKKVKNLNKNIKKITTTNHLKNSKKQKLDGYFSNCSTAFYCSLTFEFDFSTNKL